MKDEDKVIRLPTAALDTVDNGQPEDLRSMIGYLTEEVLLLSKNVQTLVSILKKRL